MEMINDLYKMSETLGRELSRANRKIETEGGELDPNDMHYVDMLAHAIKSIKTTIAMEEAGDYSERGSYAEDGRGYRNGMNGSMARGRVNPPRDNMGRFSGRYAYDNGLSTELRRLVPMAMDDQTRMEMQRLADRIDRG